MKKYLIAASLFIAGLWILNLGMTDALNPKLSTVRKLSELIVGMLVGSAGVVVYKYARAETHQPKTELDILSSLSETDKKKLTTK